MNGMYSLVLSILSIILSLTALWIRYRDRGDY